MWNSKVFSTVPVWLELLLRLPACIQISQSNLWQDPILSSFRTKRWQHPNSPRAPSCQIITGQEKPSRAWNKRKFRPSPQGRTWLSWPSCSWPKGILPPPIQKRPWLEMPLEASWRHSERHFIMSYSSDIKQKGGKLESNLLMLHKMTSLCIEDIYGGIMYIAESEVWTFDHLNKLITSYSSTNKFTLSTKVSFCAIYLNQYIIKIPTSCYNIF